MCIRLCHGQGLKESVRRYKSLKTKVIDINERRLEYISGIKFAALRAGLPQHLARGLIHTHSVHRLCAEKRRNLLLLTCKARKNLLNALFADTVEGAEAFYLLFEVVGRRYRAEGHPGEILLRGTLQFFRPPGRGTYADEQDAGCKRVERSGVAKLQVFFAEVPDSRILELAYDIGRSPAVRLVNRKDYPFGIIGDIVTERLQNQ